MHIYKKNEEFIKFCILLATGRVACCMHKFPIYFSHVHSAIRKMIATYILSTMSYMIQDSDSALLSHCTYDLITLSAKYMIHFPAFPSCGKFVEEKPSINDFWWHVRIILQFNLDEYTKDPK